MKGNSTDAASEPTGTGNDNSFPVTVWTKLNALRAGDGTNRHAALDFLIRRYWKPVYRYLRGRGYAEEDAKDLVQGFLAEALETNLFAKADPQRSRFRNLLLKSLQNHVANAERAAGAKKRKPPQGFVYLDECITQEASAAWVPLDTETPDEVYHRTWLQELVLRVLLKLEAECSASGKMPHYDLLRQRIINPILEGAKAPPMRQLAAKHGLSEKEAGARLVTARRAYYRLLRDEIRVYALSEKEVDEGIQDLWRFMSE